MITTLKDDKYSYVWRDDDGWVYKQQHEFLTDNEIWCLKNLAPSGYVPEAEQVDRDLIRIKYIGCLPDTRVKDDFLDHTKKMLDELSFACIAHGDLTQPNIRIGMDGHPFMIDFAESRLNGDPRPAKRPEGDVYWLTRTMKEIWDSYRTTNDSPSNGR